MMKLYTDMIQRLLLVSVWAKYIRGVDMERVRQDVRQWSQDRGSGDSNLNLQVAYALDSLDTSSNEHQLDPLIDILSKKLTDLNKDNKIDGDLIDMMVKTLQLPYVPNILAGRTLQALKKVLLLPEELAGLSGRLDKEEKACSNCAKDLINSEAVCIVDNGGRYQVMCLNCATAATVKCPSCAVNIPFSERYTAKKVKCELHAKTEEKQEDVPRVMAAPPRIQFRADGGLRAGRGQPIVPVRVRNDADIGVWDFGPMNVQAPQPPQPAAPENFWGDLNAEGVQIGGVYNMRMNQAPVAVDIEAPNFGAQQELVQRQEARIMRDLLGEANNAIERIGPED